MDTIKALDESLPKGSHVVLVSLVDGRLLYDIMNTEMHPLGEYLLFVVLFVCVENYIIPPP